MRALKNKRGFTLIEVIVTLVIIALLAGITIPSFTGYIDKTNSESCLSQRTSLNEMFSEYCAWEGCEYASANYANFLKYNGLESIFKCPSGGEYSFDDATHTVKCSKHG